MQDLPASSPDEPEARQDPWCCGCRVRSLLPAWTQAVVFEVTLGFSCVDAGSTEPRLADVVSRRAEGPHGHAVLVFELKCLHAWTEAELSDSPHSSPEEPQARVVTRLLYIVELKCLHWPACPGGGRTERLAPLVPRGATCSRTQGLMRGVAVDVFEYGRRQRWTKTYPHRLPTRKIRRLLHAWCCGWCVATQYNCVHGRRQCWTKTCPHRRPTRKSRRLLHVGVCMHACMVTRAGLHEAGGANLGGDEAHGPNVQPLCFIYVCVLCRFTCRRLRATWPTFAHPPPMSSCTTVCVPWKATRTALCRTAHEKGDNFLGNMDFSKAS